MTVTALKSKTWAAWLALLGGGLGLHRFYLYGWRDLLAWLHPLPTVLGLIGLWRLQNLGEDDRLAWFLLPLLGLILAATMFMAILYGLMPDARWDAKFNAGRTSGASGWPVIFAVVLALLLGATSLMSAIALSAQRYFEAQAAASNPNGNHD